MVAKSQNEMTRQNDRARGLSRKEVPSTEDKPVEVVLSVRRVAKVIKGGRRLAFSAFVVVGDRKGNVGIALGKSKEASSAIGKALRRAYKRMVCVSIYKTTIPFDIEGRHGASKVTLCSTSKGTGVIAGGAVRAIMEALGVKDILSKVFGPSNSQNVAYATMNALKRLRSARHIAWLRDKSINEILGKDSHVSA